MRKLGIIAILILILAGFLHFSTAMGDAKLPDPQWPVPPIGIRGSLGEYRSTHFHGGLDLDGQKGVTIVHSADSGCVHRRISDLNPHGAGNRYTIVHDDGSVTRYLHLHQIGFQKDTPTPEPSQSPVIMRPNPQTPVAKGCPLAFLGDTGAGGIHLHFEVRGTVTFTPAPPTCTPTATPTATQSPTPTPTIHPGSPTWTPAPTWTPTVTPTATVTPTPVQGPPIETDYINVFDYLSPPSTLPGMPVFQQALIIPELGAKVEPMDPANANVRYAPGLPGSLLLNLTGTEPLPFRLKGKCKFVVQAFDRINASGSKLGLYWIQYRRSGEDYPNYRIEFDKVLSADEHRQNDIFRTDKPFQSRIGGAEGTQYLYKLYYDRAPTPEPYNVKAHEAYGIFDGAQFETGDEVTLLVEASQYAFVGFPTPTVRQRTIKVTIDNPTYWVDCVNGSDEEPGTFDEPFKTITHALSVAGLYDHIFVKPGECSEDSGESFPLTIPDTVHLEGSGYFSLDAGATVIDGYCLPRRNAIEVENAGRSTVIEGFAIHSGLAGIYLSHASPVIRHNRVIANSSAGIWCVDSSSPLILNNLIVTNGGDGIYVQGMTVADPPVEIYGNTINGNSYNGIYSSVYSYICVLDCNITNNGKYGIDAEYSSTQIMSFIVFYGNVYGPWYFPPYPGTGIVYADPLYVGGPYGSYYLEQTERQTSPGVDAGSTDPEDYGLNDRTTDSNGSFDQGRLDMGFHHQAASSTETPTETPSPSETPTPTGSPSAMPADTPYYSPTPIPSPEVVGSLHESFDGDLEGWTWDGLWHVVSDDPEDEYYTPYAQVSDGSRAFWYGQNGNGTYDTGEVNSGVLISPSLLVTDPFSLVYESWERTEGEGYGFDTRKVYVSLDNGDSWQQLNTSNENRGQFHQVVLNLSQFEGLVIRLKFEFDTVDERFNSFTGWFVDNVRVEIYRPVPNLSQWGILVLLAMFGLLFIRKTMISRKPHSV